MKLFRYCLYLWLIAIVAGLLKQVKKFKNTKEIQFDDKKISIFSVSLNSNPYRIVYVISRYSISRYIISKFHCIFFSQDNGFVSLNKRIEQIPKSNCNPYLELNLTKK